MAPKARTSLGIAKCVSGGPQGPLEVVLVYDIGVWQHLEKFPIKIFL